MKKNSVIALILASLMCTAALTSCGKNEEKKPVSDDTNKTEVTDKTNESEDGTPSAPDRENNPIGLNAYNWKYEPDEVLFTIGGVSTTFGEYLFNVMSYKNMTDGGDESYWTEETNAEFMESYIEQFKMYAAIKLYADENNLTLGEEDYAMIDEHINGFIAQLGEEGFQNLLLDNFVTEDVYRKVLEYDLYSMKLPELFTATEAEVLEYASENYVHVKHILLATRDDQQNELDSETIKEKEKLAQEIYERAINGEDFDELMKQYGEDPGMEAQPEGYTFTYGMMVPEFEAKSFELEVGEISEPVKAYHGYHIIKKLPLEITADSAEYAECEQGAVNQKMSDAVIAFADTLEVEYTDAYKNLTMANIGTLTEEARRAAQVTEMVENATVTTDAPEAE